MHVTGGDPIPGTDAHTDDTTARCKQSATSPSIYVSKPISGAVCPDRLTTGDTREVSWLLPGP